ncbi:MAG: inosine/xanthosine triphosphatase [Euryarchaeota archaeon]|nr:inosine/xanthosine triphosphatase [Euryarchaeota archaeon]
MKVVLGGTFEYMHRGHRALLEKAFEIGESITIGITADNFKEGVQKDFATRSEEVRKFAERFGKKFRIVKIHDLYGPTLTEDFDAIVVSEETRVNAELINREREKRNMKPMKIITIPIYLAQDLLPISSRRIRAGLIDEEGKRLKPLRVAVGSQNPSKINAVRSVFERVFKLDMEFIPKSVDSGVPPQPFEEETVQGALNRAQRAMENEDYSVGIEAGLFWDDVMKEYLDRAYCVILDYYGRTTFGHTGGFVYPPRVIEMVKDGMEVGVAMEQLTGISEIKKKMGAIGYLSNGLISRDEFNAQAVLMAMIPRVGAEHYLNAVQDTQTLSHH